MAVCTSGCSALLGEYQYPWDGAGQELSRDLAWYSPSDYPGANYTAQKQSRPDDYSPRKAKFAPTCLP